MNLLLTRVGLALALWVSAPALAEAPSASADNSAVSGVLIEIEDDDTIVPPFDVEVRKVKGMAIYGANGEEIGEIKEVLATPDGKAAAVTSDIGGFIGIGEREVVIPVEKIEFEGLKVSLPMTRDEIETLPPWEH